MMNRPADLLLHFPPHRRSALRRALSVRADDYGRTRNAVGGAVSGLSPYVTHGLIGMHELLEIWRQRLGLTLADKLCQQLAWRAFFQHSGRLMGDAILADISPRAANIDYASNLPADIRMAATGVPVIDHSVRQLYQTGYLHNHQRLWLASYIVHLRKIDWRVGADWLYGHLLDGDLASNHLSWQWVAGTFSSKPYLFNAENVARFAPALRSEGTSIDRSYEELEALAASPQAVAPESVRPLPTREPALLPHPPRQRNEERIILLRKRKVVLVHPWMIASPLADAPPDALRIGLIHLPAHQARPWNTRRWEFVQAAMRNSCDEMWVGDLRHAQHWLEGVSEVCSQYPLDDAYRHALDQSGVRMLGIPAPWPEPELPCASYSAYFRTITRHAPELMESGLRGQVRRLRDESQ